MFTKDTAKYKASFITPCHSKVLHLKQKGLKAELCVPIEQIRSERLCVRSQRGLLFKSDTAQEDGNGSGLRTKRRVLSSRVLGRSHITRCDCCVFTAVKPGTLTQQ